MGRRFVSAFPPLLWQYSAILLQSLPRSFIGRDAEDPKSEIPGQTSIHKLSGKVALLRRSIEDVLRRLPDAVPRLAEPPKSIEVPSQIRRGEVSRATRGIKHEITRQRSITIRRTSAHAPPAGDSRLLGFQVGMTSHLRGNPGAPSYWSSWPLAAWSSKICVKEI